MLQWFIKSNLLESTESIECVFMSENLDCVCSAVFKNAQHVLNLPHLLICDVVFHHWVVAQITDMWHVTPFTEHNLLITFNKRDVSKSLLWGSFLFQKDNVPAHVTYWVATPMISTPKNSENLRDLWRNNTVTSCQLHVVHSWIQNQNNKWNVRACNRNYFPHVLVDDFGFVCPCLLFRFVWQFLHFSTCRNTIL